MAETGITVSTQVLRWARTQRGLTVEVAAKRLGISVDRLNQIEAGERQPSMAQLRHMAEQYKRPLIVLLLDEPPTTFTALKDFRLLPGEDPHAFSPALMDEINRAEQQQLIYSELKGDVGEKVARPTLPSERSLDQLAAALRNLLGVTYEQQRSWTDPRRALSEWRGRIEAQGILVLEASRVPLSEMRGFSLGTSTPLVMVLNGGDAPRGKVFTMLHELAHLSLRDPGVCDLHSDRRADNDVEIFCNAVAGEALLPRAIVQKLPVVKNHRAGTPWSDDELNRLVQAGGGASEESILRRLLDLQLVSRSEFNARTQQLREGYEEWRRTRNTRSKGGPPPHRVQLRDRGRPFIRSVFDAYAEGHINLSEVVDLAGVRTKHLANLQREAYQ